MKYYAIMIGLLSCSIAASETPHDRPTLDKALYQPAPYCYRGRLISNPEVRELPGWEKLLHEGSSDQARWEAFLETRAAYECTKRQQQKSLQHTGHA